MFVFGDDKISIGHHSTIHEFIVVWIGRNQMPVIAGIYFLRIGSKTNDFQYHSSDLPVGFLAKDFFVFLHYIVGYAQIITAL